MIDHHHVLNLRRMAKKRGPGRPSFGVTEESITFRAPKSLINAMATRAQADGISASEAWRRAAQKWLGIPASDYTKHLDGKAGE